MYILYVDVRLHLKLKKIPCRMIWSIRPWLIIMVGCFAWLIEVAH